MAELLSPWAAFKCLLQPLRLPSRSPVVIDADMLTLVTLSFAVRECTGSGKACQKKSRRQLQHNGSTEGIDHDDHNAGVDDAGRW